MQNKKKTLKVLAVFLIITETLMIGYSYFISLSWMGVGVAFIYLFLALSDLIAEDNKILTGFLIFISVTISLPRAILQVNEVVETGKATERKRLQSIEKPVMRNFEITLLDCGRIPYWQGQLQIECSISNKKQIEEKNNIEKEYNERLENYKTFIRDSEIEIKEGFLRYINLNSLAQILLILLVTPILPITVILLIHEDFSIFSRHEEEYEEEAPVKTNKSKKKTIHTNNKMELERREKAKVLLRAGIKVTEIQTELGLSRSTLYRYKKELE
jgi:hypothetical protein